MRNRLVCILTLMIMATSGLAQATPVQALYDRLIKTSETNAAAPAILDMAKTDSTARDFLAGKLPLLIVDQLPSNARTANPVWLNAVRLTGQLKIVNAVPALKQALSRPEMWGGYDFKNTGASTFATDAKLTYDIVGRALADIGDHSVPSVADFLSNGDLLARRRAIAILAYIDSPAARKALLDHLPSESDPGVTAMIQRLLHISQ